MSVAVHQAGRGTPVPAPAASGSTARTATRPVIATVVPLHPVIPSQGPVNVCRDGVEGPAVNRVLPDSSEQTAR